MNFIEQSKAFDEISAGNLTPTAIAIYYHLFHVNNRCGWREWFFESDYWIGAAVGVKRHETILAAINLLKQKGFIDFERGNKRNQPTMYKLMVLNNSTEHSTKHSTKYSTKDSTEHSTKDSTKHSTNIKHKQETKTKTSSTDVYTVDGFAEFWTAYPRKVGKAKAAESYAKIAPSKELQEIMLRAVAAASRSQQWQKDGGQFIPHAATWLNQRRWEDEIAVGNSPEIRNVVEFTEEEEARMSEYYGIPDTI